MIEFISTIRIDRRREIAKYEEKGYTILNKNKYRFREKIVVLADKIKDTPYGVEVDSEEVRFFIKKNDSNVYLSLMEIYWLIKKMKRDRRDTMIGLLKTQLEMNKTTKREVEENNGGKGDGWSFIYRDIKYKIGTMIDFKSNWKVKIDNCELSISGREIFLLIHLIQEKSNAFFISGGKDSKNLIYMDGVLRLFIVFLTLNESHEVLMKRGWKFDEKEKRFVFDTVMDEEKTKEKTKEIKKLKYYLTENEYETIMS